MTPCREWQGARTDGGIGQRRIDGKTIYLHRWSVAQIDGWDAIEGKVVMHLCDNPPCYRYDHLQIGTASDNALDWRRKFYTPVTECKYGHPYDEENTQIDPRGRRNCRACWKRRRTP